MSRSAHCDSKRMVSPHTSTPSIPPDNLQVARRTAGWITLAYALLLFVATHIPSSQIPTDLAQADKFAHVGAYAGLGFFTALWVALNRPLTARLVLALILTIALYGVVDEWLQQFFDRTPDREDWLADISGATFGILLVWLLQRLRPLSRGGSGE
jgi:VanZ family protein